MPNKKYLRLWFYSLQARSVSQRKYNFSESVGFSVDLSKDVFNAILHDLRTNSYV
jgi:hypothetical protein